MEGRPPETEGFTPPGREPAVGPEAVAWQPPFNDVESEDPDAWPRTLRNAMADGIEKCS